MLSLSRLIESGEYISRPLVFMVSDPRIVFFFQEYVFRCLPRWRVNVVENAYALHVPSALSLADFSPLCGFLPRCTTINRPSSFLNYSLSQMLQSKMRPTRVVQSNHAHNKLPSSAHSPVSHVLLLLCRSKRSR